MKFHGSPVQGMRYAEDYTANDTVGCSINMQTGKVFFTLNGKNLGQWDDQTTVYKPLTHRKRHCIYESNGDVVSRDWVWGARGQS